MEWQPIETAPSDTVVLLWIRSKQNPSYGRLGEGSKINGEWLGPKAGNPMFGEYETHWMLIQPPKEQT